MYLYHFARTPPGIGGPELLPRSHDLSPQFSSALTPEAKKLYRGQKFVFAIPDYSLEAWQRSGQLKSLEDLLVKMDWFNYSIEQWKINTRELDLSSTLVREAYYFSPQALRYRSDMHLSPSQKKKYDEGYARMLNSVQPFLDYQNDFINPEVLLPFPIPVRVMTLERVIE